MINMLYKIKFNVHHHDNETRLELTLDQKMYEQVLCQEEPTAILIEGVFWYLERPYKFEKVSPELTIIDYSIVPMAVFDSKGHFLKSEK